MSTTSFIRVFGCRRNLPQITCSHTVCGREGENMVCMRWAHRCPMEPSPWEAEWKRQELKIGSSQHRVSIMTSLWPEHLQSTTHSLSLSCEDCFPSAVHASYLASVCLFLMNHLKVYEVQKWCTLFMDLTMLLLYKIISFSYKTSPPNRIFFCECWNVDSKENRKSRKTKNKDG